MSLYCNTRLYSVCQVVSPQTKLTFWKGIHEIFLESEENYWVILLLLIVILQTKYLFKTSMSLYFGGDVTWGELQWGDTINIPTQSLYQFKHTLYRLSTGYYGCDTYMVTALLSLRILLWISFSLFYKF